MGVYKDFNGDFTAMVSEMRDFGCSEKSIAFATKSFMDEEEEIKTEYLYDQFISSKKQNEMEELKCKNY